MTERQMASLIAIRHRDFSLNKMFCTVPNVSYGGFYWGEADIISVTKSGYMTEGEIKITFSDFKADFKKKKYREGTKHNEKWIQDIKKHYFIVPEEMKDKCLKYLEENNSNSGLIYVGINKNDNLYCFTEKEPVVNKKAKKLSDSRLLKICRLVCFRYWDKEFKR